MTVKLVVPPQEVFYDANGTPLDGGFIYIGQANQNPETHPLAIYWDTGLTQAAAQPVRTVNGYPSNNGRAGTLYVGADYSMTIRNWAGQLVSTMTTSAGLAGGGNTSNQATYPFAGDGTTVSFTLPTGVGFASTAASVYVDGVYQSSDTYTLVSNILTFSEAPPAPPSGVTNNIEVNVTETIAVPIGTTSADLVTYLPGGISAVSRTVQAKLRESVSVEDFGASEGAADNAAAIQAALNYSGSIYVPWGKRYRIKSQLTRTGALHLYGGGSLVWTSDATSSGLLVTLTTNDQFSDQVVVEGIQFRTEQLATGTALYIDCRDANSPPGRVAPYLRFKIDGCSFRGDVAPSQNGWQHNIYLVAGSNGEITGCNIAGCLDATIGAGEAGIATLSGIYLDESSEPTAHINIARCNITYCQDAVFHNGAEGVYVDKCNIIAVNRGVAGINAGTPTQAPHMTISNTHINARSRGVVASAMAGVFIKDCYIWERSSATAASIGADIINCDEAIIEGNIFQGNPVTTGQTYRAVVISGTSTDCFVKNNIGENVTEFAWTQTGTDKIIFENNQTLKDGVLAPAPILYVNTSAGEIIYDAKVFSGETSVNITAPTSTLVDIDMGDVHLGQKFLVTATATYTKGGTTGFTTTAILKASGTGAVRFVHDATELRVRYTQTAAAIDNHTVSGLMTVTTAGTLVLRSQFTSAGSDATVAAGEAQLSVVQIGTSGRIR